LFTGEGDPGRLLKVLSILQELAIVVHVPVWGNFGPRGAGKGADENGFAGKGWRSLRATRLVIGGGRKVAVLLFALFVQDG